ncbi:MAG: GntR family transcriptional regulator [Anaerolineae bacterium]|nr:GntR family transcriptional regulator [Anaerolineae bacterium]MDW8101253.1 GntR family transcriptional regulator [Anaerolineae bacterium]
MDLYVNHNSPIPLYYQIYEQLRREILNGNIRPGELLPSETQICEQCGVSRMTARMALAQLANEGLVVRRKGKGTFVAPPKVTFQDSPFLSIISYTNLMRSLGLSAGAQIRSKEVIPAPSEVREALRLAEGEKVIRIIRLRLANEQPMALETSFLPYRLFPGLVDMDLTGRSLYQVLEEEFSMAPAYAIDTIELSTAGPYEAAELKIRVGTPVVLSVRIAFSSRDVPLVFGRTVHRGDRFRATLRCTREQLCSF